MDKEGQARLTAEVYRKLRRGDSLTDEEINIAIRVLQEHILLLQLLGPVFSLPYQELSKTLSDLEGFQAARREKKS